MASAATTRASPAARPMTLSSRVVRARSLFATSRAGAPRASRAHAGLAVRAAADGARATPPPPPSRFRPRRATRARRRSRVSPVRTSALRPKTSSFDRSTPRDVFAHRDATRASVPRRRDVTIDPLLPSRLTMSFVLNKLPLRRRAAARARGEEPPRGAPAGVDDASGAFYLTLVPIRPRRRGERRSLRTFPPGASLRPGSLAFNPRPRRLSTPPDAFELHPDVRSYGTTLRRVDT